MWKSNGNQVGSNMYIKRIRKYIPNIVVGWRSRVRQHRLCVWCEGCCSTGFSTWM